jgi:exopolysaccharide production protein ExoQ
MPDFDWRLGAFLGGFVGLAALSIFWSYDPSYAAARTGKIGVQIAALFVLLALMRTLPFTTLPHRNLLAAGGALLIGVTGFVFFFEYLLGFPLMMQIHGVDTIYDYAPIHNANILNRNLVFLTLLCFPALLFLHHCSLGKITKLALTAFALCGMGLALSLTKSQTAQIAGLVALILVFYPSTKTWARRMFAGACLLLLFAAPFLPPFAYNMLSQKEFMQEGWVHQASAVHRLEVWNFMAEEIHKKPFLGHGVEAARFLKAEKYMENMKSDHVMHPHNAFLQIWLEMGAAGALITAAFLIFLFRRIDTLPPRAQRYAIAFTGTLLCVLCIGYSLWQAWQIGMIFSLIAFSLIAMKEDSDNKVA